MHQEVAVESWFLAVVPGLCCRGYQQQLPEQLFHSWDVVGTGGLV